MAARWAASPLLRRVDGVAQCRLSALLPKAKHHRGGAQRAAAARRLVPARDVSLGRGTWRTDAS